MKLGIEKKEERWKVYVLGGLALVGGWVMYSNLAPDSGSSSGGPSAARTPAAAPAPAPELSPVPAVRRKVNGRIAGDFHAKLRDSRPENRPDPAKIDPTINLAPLTRVQKIDLEGGTRNIFQFGPAMPIAPVAKLPQVKPIIPGAQKASNTQPLANAGPPPPPTAPPIPFKYYGYSSVKGESRKRAFFLDGDNVIVAWEGELIKNRYLVVHVGLRSVEMEDTQFKNAKQALPLAEDLAG
jgi:hypothetical protein